MLAVCCLAGVTAAAQNYRYGVVTQVLSEDHASHVSDLGAGYVRLDFNWYEVEHERGRFNWAVVERRVDEARSRDLRIFATLAYTPAWAGPARNELPNDLSDWASFVRACMRRYGSDVVYGVWNEPNLDRFLEDDDSGTKYRRLWQAAHEARIAVNRRYSLAGPEISHHGIGDYYERVMDSMVGAGRMLAHDKVTVHWYPDGPGLRRYMERVRENAGGREIWLTETGVGTCDDQVQADHYERVLREFARSGRGWWTKVFFYVLHNDDACSEAIVRPGWDPRPAFDRYREFIAANP